LPLSGQGPDNGFSHFLLPEMIEIIGRALREHDSVAISNEHSLHLPSSKSISMASLPTKERIRFRGVARVEFDLTVWLDLQTNCVCDVAYSLCNFSAVSQRQHVPPTKHYVVSFRVANREGRVLIAMYLKDWNSILRTRIAPVQNGSRCPAMPFAPSASKFRESPSGFGLHLRWPTRSQYADCVHGTFCNARCNWTEDAKPWRQLLRRTHRRYQNASFGIEVVRKFNGDYAAKRNATDDCRFPSRHGFP
jgi:hypothetical protein